MKQQPRSAKIDFVVVFRVVEDMPVLLSRVSCYTNVDVIHVEIISRRERKQMSGRCPVDRD